MDTSPVGYSSSFSDTEEGNDFVPITPTYPSRGGEDVCRHVKIGRVLDDSMEATKSRKTSKEIVAP